MSRRATLDMRLIYRYSQQQWGSGTADRYMAGLYQTLHQIAADPYMSHVHKIRAAPFLMIPTGQHFVVYSHLNN